MQLEKICHPKTRPLAGAQRRTAKKTATGQPGAQAGPNPKDLLWNRLSGRQLGGFRFHRDMKIPPQEVDFVSIGRRLIVEVIVEEPLDDLLEKSLVDAGYRVMFFRGQDVIARMESVLRAIRKALTEQKSRR